MVIGHQKGRDTKENLKRNFGMPHPEGYRKALRLMKLASRFGAPVITLIDTPGAYPGLGAEERGQSEALARNILEMSQLPTASVAVVIGEGGSGGALALGVADRILMLENSVYSVISPEGCAAILWKDSAQRERAAEALKITAEDLLRLKVIDEIIPEPVGGAHIDPDGRRGAPRRADPPFDRAAQAPPRKAGPPPRREVRGHGRVQRDVTNAADGRSPVQGHAARVLSVGSDDEPLRPNEPVLVEAERGQDFGRVSATGEKVEKKCAGGCNGCAVGTLAGGRRRQSGRAPGQPPDVAQANELRRHEEETPPHGGRPRPAPWARHESERHRVAVGPEQAHDLLHRRAAGGLPVAGSGSGCAVPHPHRAAPDRRARRSGPPRRRGTLRTRVLLLDLAHRAVTGQSGARQGPAPLAQPVPDLGQAADACSAASSTSTSSMSPPASASPRRVSREHGARTGAGRSGGHLSRAGLPPQRRAWIAGSSPCSSSARRWPTAALPPSATAAADAGPSRTAPPSRRSPGGDVGPSRQRPSSAGGAARAAADGAAPEAAPPAEPPSSTDSRSAKRRRRRRRRRPWRVARGDNGPLRAAASGAHAPEPRLHGQVLHHHRHRLR